MDWSFGSTSLVNIRRLHVVDDVAAHREEVFAIAPPRIGSSYSSEPRKLGQRTATPLRGCNCQRPAGDRVKTLGGNGAGDHVDMLDALAGIA